MIKRGKSLCECDHCFIQEAAERSPPIFSMWKQREDYHTPRRLSYSSAIFNNADMQKLRHKSLAFIRHQVYNTSLKIAKSLMQDYHYIFGPDFNTLEQLSILIFNYQHNYKQSKIKLPPLNV